MSRGARLSVVMLALLATACPWDPACDRCSEPRVDTPRELEFSRDDRPSRDAELRRALYSITYHSQSQPPRLAPAFEPVPLGEAARILRLGSERNPIGDLRLRHAVVELAAGGLVRTDEGWSIRQPNDGAIGFLLGSFKGRFDDAISRYLANVPEGTSSELPLETLANVHASLWDFLNEALGPAGGGCNVSFVGTPPATMDAEGVVHATATVELTRDSAALAEALDPQNWDAIDGGTGATCNPFFPVAMPFRKTLAGGWECADPPTSGSAWDGFLFEHFRNDMQPWGVADLKTILDVTPILSTPPPVYAFEYDLNHSFYGQISGLFLEANGLIDVDEGTLVAVKDPSTDVIRVSASKSLRFVDWQDTDGRSVDWQMNEVTKLVIQAMGGAMSTAVCCEPLQPEPCP
jgi:hypothetical protein